MKLAFGSLSEPICLKNQFEDWKRKFMKWHQIVLLAVVLVSWPTSGRASGIPFDAYASTSAGTSLYSDSGVTLAPVGSPIWFVADTTGGGIASLLQNSGTTIQATDVQSILNDSASASLQWFATLSVGGGLLRNQDGALFQSTISNIDPNYANDHIYVFLWDAQNVSNVGQVNDTFGYLDLGVNPPPGVGNATYSISQNMFANQITVVPEPGAFAAVLGLGALGWAGWRKLRPRSNQ